MPDSEGMGSLDVRQCGRPRFVEIVRWEFAQLLDCGFSEVDALPSIVRYRKGDLYINVFHGRVSSEVGVDMKWGEDCFSLPVLLYVAGVDPCRDFRYRSTISTEGITSAVRELSGLILSYGQGFLRGDLFFRDKVRQVAPLLLNESNLDWLEGHVRPLAQVAFREGRYKDAADLYGQIASRLTPVEQAKLMAARRRS